MTNNIKARYGLSVSGKIRVFRKDKTVQGKNKKTYTITDVWFNVSEREESGAYFNKSLNLLFARDLTPPANNVEIIIHNAFPVITGNGDYRKIAFMVTGYELAPTDTPDDNQPDMSKPSKIGELTDDDIPF